MGILTFVPLGFLSGYVFSWILKKANLLRVPPEVEIEGLDMAEFQQDFYPEFERAPGDHHRPRRRGARRRADPARRVRHRDGRQGDHASRLVRRE